MDWATILKVGGPVILSLLKNLGTGLATDAPPTTPGTAVKVPSKAIKDLQQLLNIIIQPNPPLEVDGWLGPQTEAAIEAGIAKLRAAGIG